MCKAMNSRNRNERIGLFTSNPLSSRCKQLEAALQELGTHPLRVYPWLVSQSFSSDGYRVDTPDTSLHEIDLMYVIDIGAMNIGSFLHRLGLLSMLEDNGVEVINSVKTIQVMRNKAETLRHLEREGLLVPQTIVTESIDRAAKFARKMKECVVKPIIGFGGTGVQYIHKQFDLENIYDLLKFHTQMFGKGAFLLQEFIESPGFDIRALVVDGTVISSMQRVSRGGFLTNIHAGGVPMPNDININDLAVKAANAIGGRIVGVDILPDRDGEFWVLEVNATPGWSGLQSVTDFDITEKIARTLAFRH